MTLREPQVLASGMTKKLLLFEAQFKVLVEGCELSFSMFDNSSGELYKEYLDTSSNQRLAERHSFKWESTTNSAGTVLKCRKEIKEYWIYISEITDDE